MLKCIWFIESPGSEKSGVSVWPVGSCVDSFKNKILFSWKKAHGKSATGSNMGICLFLSLIEKCLAKAIKITVMVLYQREILHGSVWWSGFKLKVVALLTEKAFWNLNLIQGLWKMCWFHQFKEKTSFFENQTNIAASWLECVTPFHLFRALLNGLSGKIFQMFWWCARVAQWIFHCKIKVILST